MSNPKFDWAKVEGQLSELRAQIRELLTKLETAVGKEAEALRPKLKAAQDRLNELKEASAEAWEDLKPGLRKAWEELHKSLNQAASRFKTPPKQLIQTPVRVQPGGAWRLLIQAELLHTEL